MKETPETFVLQRRPRWKELEGLIMRHPRLRKAPPETIARVAALYRDLCTDRMRADHLGCPPGVLTALDALVARAHSTLYSSRKVPLKKAVRVLVYEFPRALRRNLPTLALASFLFWVPFALALVGSLHSQEFAQEVVPREILEGMADAYGKGFAEGRNGSKDAAMAGFYVYNNIGIAFRCFATGILFGLGSTFFLAYNGVATGAVVGHVVRSGGGINILSFIAGHGPLELTAIVISGAAGLQMGDALIRTRGLTRLGSLWRARHDLSAQIGGAAMMLALAALIEGFWSPSSLPHEIKWGFGGFMVVLVGSFFAFVGRERKPAA